MLKMNPTMKILVENARSFSERNKIMSLMENEQQAVNNTMISNLYKSAIEKAHIDFDDIPDSKGDVTAYKGYTSMTESLSIIESVATKHGVKVPELEIVKDALSHIVSHRDVFTKGFALNREFAILQYNTLVYACVEATSILIASYVDFAKRPDRIEFTIIKDTKRGGGTAIQNLDKFNMTVKRGEFSKVMNQVVNAGQEGFVGVGSVVVPTVIIGGVLVLVPLIRELIFGFYYSRMKLSDYLEQQATLIEINKQNIQSSSLPAKKRNEIVKKQEQYINRLRRASDSIKVSSTMADNKATIEMNKQNKAWTIDEVQTQAASSDDNGFQLL